MKCIKVVNSVTGINSPPDRPGGTTKYRRHLLLWEFKNFFSSLSRYYALKAIQHTMEGDALRQLTSSRLIAEMLGGFSCFKCVRLLRSAVTTDTYFPQVTLQCFLSFFPLHSLEDVHL